MAFNWPSFRTRTITALFFVAVMLTGLWWNHWSFLLLFSLIHFGCWWELLKLAEKIFSQRLHAYSKMGLMGMGYGIFLWCCGPAWRISGYGLRENFSLPVSAAGFALVLAGIFLSAKPGWKSYALGLLGLVYISLSLGLMMDIAGMVTGPGTGKRVFTHYNKYLPTLIIFSIWVNDTMAYIAGSLIGRTPFSRISPKKTWEGTIGGILLAGIIGFAVPYFFRIPFVDTRAGIAAASIAIAGTFGDLFESKLKRMAGVKDSGQILPGHGGFLDRFDSLLFAVPVAWVLFRSCFFSC